MKKIIYTLSALAFFALAGKAQTPSKQEPKKETAPATEQSKPAAVKKGEQAHEPKAGTRMAINEKGVPASKASTAKEKKEASVIGFRGEQEELKRHRMSG